MTVDASNLYFLPCKVRVARYPHLRCRVSKVQTCPEPTSSIWRCLKEVRQRQDRGLFCVIDEKALGLQVKLDGYHDGSSGVSIRTAASNTLREHEARC